MENLNEDIEKFIEREKPYLLSQALYITGKTEDAEDLFQETLMKACKGFNGFKRDTNFRAWARKIMINTHINRIKHQMSYKLLFVNSYLNFENIFFNDLPRSSTMDDPEIIFFNNYISEEIMGLFNSLPEDYRTVFSLFHFNGYPYDKISRIINIPVGTVKSRIHRAKQYLTEQIGNAHSVGNATH